MMLECRKKVKIDLEGSKMQKVKIWQYIFLVMRVLGIRKIQFEKEKFKIRCLWTQLNFIQGLIWFIEGLIIIKLIF